MALRLTGTTQTPDIPAAVTAPTAQTLALQAQASLAANDVGAYAKLFATVEEIEHPQRRYEARLALLDAGFSATGRAPEAVATRLFVAIADAILESLEQEPSEPLLLNLAGVACYELWSLDAAQALFRAARRLDPSLREAERNLQEVAQRKRAGRRIRPLHAAIPALARRARTAAAHAKPTAGLTLSLCMIVRDEEQMLPRCLAAVAPAVDEIVIVDTGSTDGTVEIARSFGARVIEFEWTGSFSEARNVSFEAATSDWVMYLDADEILVTEDIEQLRELTGRTWREAFYVVETSYTGELEAGGAVVNNALRIFRNRPEYRFRNRLHEQIAYSLPTYVPGRVEETGVRVQHYGYLGSVREAKEKSQRNVELLRRQAAESTPTPFLHFNLGSEYAAAGEPGSAIEEFRRARALLIEQGGLAGSQFAPTLMARLVAALSGSGRLDEARTTAAEGLAQFPDFTDLVLAQAQIAQAFGDDEGAAALYERCIELGDSPSKYHAVVGTGTFLPRVALANLSLKRGDTAAARAALEWCVEHHPEFLAVAGPFVGALVREGVDPADAVAQLDRLDALTPAVRQAVAAALREVGAAAAAEEQYRLALTASPGDARTRTTLGELLLGRGAWDEAVEAVEPVSCDDPYAGLARRIELCGVIGRADRAATDAALTRASQADLPRAEYDVFAAWAAIAAGAPAPQGLALSGVPILAVVLQTLLAAGDTARFAALVPALEQSQLDRREQRELLAEMYLGRGMLANAAQEWMAVCSQQPDSRALLGLAKVALGHGMPEDAFNFATGALELDPACRPARQLLALVAPATVA